MRKYDYRDNMGFIVKSTAKAFESAFDQLLRNKVGVTVTQSRVLGVLALVKNGMTQRELADRIGVEAPSIVPTIDKLEEQKLVIRRPDATDRRNNLIFMTVRAEEKWDLIIDCAAELQKSSSRGLSEMEIGITKATLRKIAENISGAAPLIGKTRQSSGLSARKPVQ